MNKYVGIGVVAILIIIIFVVLKGKKTPKKSVTPSLLPGAAPALTSKYNGFFVRGSDNIVYWVENSKRVHWHDKTTNSEVAWSSSKVVPDAEINAIPFA